MVYDFSSNDKTSPPTVVKMVTPDDVNMRMTKGDTFVVNIVAKWCPDCTQRQSLHIESFAHTMKNHDIDVLQLNVQTLKNVFISDSHEIITVKFGGHGYPRTVLIYRGTVLDNNNVEVITEDTLSALAIKFIDLLAKQCD